MILDACHSGLALGPIIQWRSRGVEAARNEPLEHLRARRSRRVITSALDDQRAMDGGPVPGHSLFTGCLLEAMSGGLMASVGHHVVTGSEIGYYVQRRVSEYPGAVQTPDFGALELDDRGELLVRIADEVANTDPELPALSVRKPGSGDSSSIRAPSIPSWTAAFVAASNAPVGKAARFRRRRWVMIAVAGVATATIGVIIALSAAEPSRVVSTEGRAAVVVDTAVAIDAAVAVDAATPEVAAAAGDVVATGAAAATRAVPADASIDAPVDQSADAAIRTRLRTRIAPRTVTIDSGIPPPPNEPILEPARTDDKPLPAAR